ncbi:hypothetical protein MUO65_06110, partial [bacterium]|nr:hypothetical protein [bacterium]
NTISRMEKEGVKVAVLIAGGFHTPGITELLRERNISYVVVTPHLGENDSSDLQISPRKERTDLEKAIAGIVGALRPASLLGDASFRVSFLMQLKARALFEQFQRRLVNAQDIWRRGIDNVNLEFLSVVLTRGREAFAVGTVKGSNGSLPFVLPYNVDEKKFSEPIFGEVPCRRFFLSGPFDNAAEVEVVEVAYVQDKLKQLWPFLSETEIMTAIFGKARPEPVRGETEGTATEEGETSLSRNPIEEEFPDGIFQRAKGDWRLAITGRLQKGLAAFGKTPWNKWMVMLLVFLCGEFSKAQGATEIFRQVVDKSKERPEIPTSIMLALFAIPFVILILRKLNRRATEKPNEASEELPGRLFKKCFGLLRAERTRNLVPGLYSPPRRGSRKPWKPSPEEKERALKIYMDTYNKTRHMEISINLDIEEAGITFACEIMKAIQYWMKKLPKDEKIVIHFCTGDTPWIGYTKMARYLDSWDDKETQTILEAHGVDLNLKPDMSRVVAYPLDAVFPQKRTAYHSFANILNNMFDRLHIPEDQRHFFYGDIDEYDNQMSDEAFDRIIKDIEKNGLLIDNSNEIQKPFINAMRHQAERMSQEMENLGGAHIFLAGIGPSYDGKGHIGFMEFETLEKFLMESGDPFGLKTFIESAHHYVNRAHAKENGGLNNFYVNGISKHGVISFGFYELLLRQRINQKMRDKTKVI